MFVNLIITELALNQLLILANIFLKTGEMPDTNPLWEIFQLLPDIDHLKYLLITLRKGY